MGVGAVAPEAEQLVLEPVEEPMLLLYVGYSAARTRHHDRETIVLAPGGSAAAAGLHRTGEMRALWWWR